MLPVCYQQASTYNIRPQVDLDCNQDKTLRMTSQENACSGDATVNFDEVYKDALTFVEGLWFKRDTSFVIGGPTAVANLKQPDLHPVGEKLFHIRVTPECCADSSRAAFQIFHETVHCLFPKTIGEVSYLEEGMAVWASIKYCRERGLYSNISDDSQLVTSEKYKKALKLYDKLLQRDVDAIHKLKELCSSFGNITKSVILEAAPTIPEELASELATPFYE